MKHHGFLIMILVLQSIFGWAQEPLVLSLPRQEQLSSQQVLQVIQDSEGFLWYATEGGGVCRDDGRQMIVFRSDAEHPDLLGSNNVASIAEADKMHIIIGTYHGAYVLDKQDYSIQRLVEVDDKRVDDIMISRDGHWWLTSNKKIYEYVSGKLLKAYPLGDKYIFRFREDSLGHIWAREWEGGLLRLEEGQFVQVTTEWPKNIDFSRTMTDRQGRQLVTDGFGKCYALSSKEQKPWFDGERLTNVVADSIRTACGLSTRPTALTYDKDSVLWFSTGKDIRRFSLEGEEVVLTDTKNVSAMTFTKDNTLCLATIFGTLMIYRDGQLSTDEYASNEFSDAIVALQTDSNGCLVIVHDRYVRLYDPVRKTLRQQSIEDAGIYCIELQETQPGERWSQPEQEMMERLPLWAWWTLGIFSIVLIALISYVWFLYRQRQRFLEAMKHETPAQEQPKEEQDVLADEWLQKAIAFVEQNIKDERYSVEELSSDLCISRMTFYRKIQSATGQKPTEFIRTIRLHHAAELLRKGNLTITEVSYETGFSSVSYFSRCFRTMFGVSPTQFGKTITTED